MEADFVNGLTVVVLGVVQVFHRKLCGQIPRFRCFVKSVVVAA